MRVRRLMQDKIRQLFTEVDVILSVSRSGAASGINEPLDRTPTPPPAAAAGKTEKKTAERPLGNSALIAAGNLAGLPALSLPCGFPADTNLPLGVQLVGRPFDELTLIALGREFQKQTDWHRKRPPAQV
jgi:aspartyl-tRNA(Asn)/glutamyl-tRNA(Gln) amidotransferase subunit A